MKGGSPPLPLVSCSNAMGASLPTATTRTTWRRRCQRRWSHCWCTRATPSATACPATFGTWVTWGTQTRVRRRPWPRTPSMCTQHRRLATRSDAPPQHARSWRACWDGARPSSRPMLRFGRSLRRCKRAKRRQGKILTAQRLPTWEQPSRKLRKRRPGAEARRLRLLPRTAGGEVGQVIAATAVGGWLLSSVPPGGARPTRWVGGIVAGSGAGWNHGNVGSPHLGARPRRQHLTHEHEAALSIDRNLRRCCSPHQLLYRGRRRKSDASPRSPTPSARNNPQGRPFLRRGRALDGRGTVVWRMAKATTIRPVKRT